MKRFIGLFLAAAMCISFISGCNSSSSTNNNWNPLNSGKEIKIAVLGSEEQFNRYVDFFYGMDMAIEELASEGAKISYEKFDDQESIDNASNIATDVADSDTYALAISLQSAAIVPYTAYLFNEKQKPIIIGSQATSGTMSAGFAYAINLTLLAAEMGYAAGKISVENNAKWVAAVHSDSIFDKEYINGFESATKGTSTSVVDIREVSNSFADVEEWVDAVKKLKPDSFVIAHYSSKYMSLLTEHAEKFKTGSSPSVPIITNATVFDSQTLQQFRNIGGISPYSIDAETEAYNNFAAKYKTIYGVNGVSTIAAEGYDAIKLIYEKIQGTTTALDFMNNVKSEEGYSGIASLKFDMYGRVITDRVNAFYVDGNGNVKLQTIYF